MSAVPQTNQNLNLHGFEPTENSNHVKKQITSTDGITYTLNIHFTVNATIEDRERELARYAQLSVLIANFAKEMKLNVTNPTKNRTLTKLEFGGLNNEGEPQIRKNYTSNDSKPIPPKAYPFRRFENKSDPNKYQHTINLFSQLYPSTRNSSSSQNVGSSSIPPQSTTTTTPTSTTTTTTPTTTTTSQQNPQHTTPTPPVPNKTLKKIKTSKHKKKTVSNNASNFQSTQNPSKPTQATLTSRAQPSITIDKGKEKDKVVDHGKDKDKTKGKDKKEKNPQIVKPILPTGDVKSTFPTECIKKTPIERLVSGRINPFKIDVGISPDEESDCTRQAEEIIEYYKNFLHLNPQGKLAITYPMSQKQAQEIFKGQMDLSMSYKSTEDSQDKLLKLVAESIRQNKLQDKIHILPILTSKDAEGKIPISFDDNSKVIVYIKEHLSADWVVLGLQNQYCTPENPFVIDNEASRQGWSKNPLRALVVKELIAET